MNGEDENQSGLRNKSRQLDDVHHDPALAMCAD